MENNESYESNLPPTRHQRKFPIPKQVSLINDH